MGEGLCSWHVVSCGLARSVAWHKPLKAGLDSLPTRCVPSHLVALETDPSDDTADTLSSGTSSFSGSSANASGF